ncbi:MAG TPA: hypothetical protein VGS04_05935 [Nitrososphaerales archaeon]|nr:hypothetical protein [Nitrososphaerales archaeon]
MRRGFGALLLGLAMLFASLALDLLGQHFQSLYVLVLSFAMGIAGAIVALRGLVDFLGTLLQ